MLDSHLGNLSARIFFFSEEALSTNRRVRLFAHSRMASIFIRGSSLLLDHSTLNSHFRLRATQLEILVALRCSLFKRLKFRNHYLKLPLHLTDGSLKVLNHVIDGHGRRSSESSSVVLALSLFHDTLEVGASCFFLVKQLFDLRGEGVNLLLLSFACCIEISSTLLLRGFLLRDEIGGLLAAHLFLSSHEFLLRLKFCSKLIENVGKFVSETIASGVFFGNQVLVDLLLGCIFLVPRLSSSFFLCATHGFVANELLEILAHLQQFGVFTLTLRGIFRTQSGILCDRFFPSLSELRDSFSFIL